MQPMHADILINARWVIPVEPDGVVLDHHSVALEDGRIVAILPTSEASEQIQADQTVDREQHALIPGLINAHGHSPMTLMRGLADDLPLMEWLDQHIWPAEARWVGEEYVQDGSQLTVAEMLAGGTTAFNDMYFFPEITARVSSAAGIRCCAGMIVIDFPSAWAGNSEDYIAKGIAMHDQFRNDPLVTTAFAPHAPYSVSRPVLERVRTLADELDVPVHIHLHETEHEISEHVAKHGMRPLADLSQIGLLSPSLVAVHMTQMNDNEIETFAESGGHIVHCPESNMKLASGFARVADWLSAGINVGLGTDGAASNNDLDMFSEMRSAAMLGKAVAADASAVPAAATLRMATLNGAACLGLQAETGSLEVGKAADIVAISLADARCQPVYHPISQLVYTCSADQVTDTWVNARHLYSSGQLTTLNVTDLVARAQSWAERINAADSAD